jgi:protein-disulfide isomerase
MRLLLAVLFALLALPAARAADPPATFTPAQRAEIVAIVRDALVRDPSILRDAVAALQASDAAQRDAATRGAIAEAGPTLTRAPGDPVAGNPRGDVTVVEFYDLRCPYCRRMLPVMAELLQQDRNVRVVYKDIPILGPESRLGARAVLAAQRQDGYARLQDLIMHGSSRITEDTLHTAAHAAGLDWNRLQRDMQDPAIEARLHTNLELAQKLGIDGTPAFVIGGQMLPGAVQLADLEEAVATARRAIAAAR